MTANMDVDASVVGLPNPASQKPPSFDRHTPPAKPSHSTTKPQDTIKSNQTNDEQSGNTHGHGADANKSVSHFTVIEQQGDLLDFLHSTAHCISADLKLGAGLAKQIKEKSPSYFPTKKSTSIKYCTHCTGVMIILFFTSLSNRSFFTNLLTAPWEKRYWLCVIT